MDKREKLIEWMICEIRIFVGVCLEILVRNLTVNEKISADFNKFIDQEISDTANNLNQENSVIDFADIIPVGIDEIIKGKLPIDLFQYLGFSIELSHFQEFESEEITGNNKMNRERLNKNDDLFKILDGYELGFFISNYIYLQLLKQLKSGKPKVISSITESGISLKIKPIFDPDSILEFYKIHKSFFSEEEQPKLLDILNTGKILNTPLLFMSNGNRLADSFKKMVEYDKIKGCQKTDLPLWMSLNFKFLHNKEVLPFKPGYVARIISRNGFPCMNPIIEIIGGEIQKVDLPNKRKQTKN